MAQYDPSEIQKFADRLYLKADMVVVFATISGLFVGLFAAAICISAFKIVFPEFGPLPGAIVGIVSLLLFGGIGYVIGDWRSFAFRLQAQQSLCWVQVEVNLRTLIVQTSPEEQARRAKLAAYDEELRQKKAQRQSGNLPQG